MDINWNNLQNLVDKTIKAAWMEETGYDDQMAVLLCTDGTKVSIESGTAGSRGVISVTINEAFNEFENMELGDLNESVGLGSKRETGYEATKVLENMANKFEFDFNEILEIWVCLRKEVKYLKGLLAEDPDDSRAQSDLEKVNTILAKVTHMTQHPNEYSKSIEESIDKTFDAKYDNRIIIESAGLGSKVKYKGQTGYVNAEMQNGKLIVQVQGSTYTVDPKDLKEMHPREDNVLKAPIRFDDQTQKVLFEQYVRCGIFYNNVPVKTTDCFVRYNQYEATPEDGQVKILIEGTATFMPKSQVVILDNINEFASAENYIPGVIIDEATEEVLENILLNAIDYSQAIGDADSVRIIKFTPNGDQEMQNAPKSMLRTLSI